MKTLSKLKALNKRKGFHWFDPETLEFWGTKFESDIIAQKYFITSEKDSTGLKRLFTVRECSWETGRISTVGEFQAHLDTYKAKQWLIEYCKKQVKSA